MRHAQRHSYFYRQTSKESMTSGETERKREGKVAVGGHGREIKDRAGQMKAMGGGVAAL